MPSVEQRLDAADRELEQTKAALRRAKEAEARAAENPDRNDNWIAMILGDVLDRLKALDEEKKKKKNAVAKSESTQQFRFSTPETAVSYLNRSYGTAAGLMAESERTNDPRKKRDAGLIIDIAVERFMAQTPEMRNAALALMWEAAVVEAARDKVDLNLYYAPIESPQGLDTRQDKSKYDLAA